MTQRIVQLQTDQISSEIANFAIGFALLRVEDRIEDAKAGGSGTLALVGSNYGILTAAHVLECALPRKGEVGLVLFLGHMARFQKQLVTMEDTERVIVRGDKFGPDGPDLGFIRLPQKNIGWLTATSAFYNLTKRRDEVLANVEPAPNHVDAIVGMIDERTEDLPAERSNERRKGFGALLTSGEIKRTRRESSYDLVDFEVTSHPDFELPTSFGGMSGGALWRFYFVMKDDKPWVVEKRLMGVPFYQTREAQLTTITCHGPEGIYGSLLDEIMKKWPEVSK
jgi:hypothetical protein